MQRRVPLNGSASEMQPNLQMTIIYIQLQSCENTAVFNLCKNDL